MEQEPSLIERALVGGIERVQQLVFTVQSAARRINETLFPKSYRQTQLPEGRVHPDNDPNDNMFKQVDRSHQTIRSVPPANRDVRVEDVSIFDEYKDRP